MSRKLKRFLSSLLALMMVFSLISYTPREVQAATASDYGLMDSVADGVILHAWNWSFTNIKNNMKDIAEAGYTAVQTSPVQRPKDSSMSSDNTGWWKVYQPTSLCFSPGGHPWFGTKDDFKAMCDEAEKYGVKVIVDIVANHMANDTGRKGNTRSDISSQNEETYRDDDSCWHLNGSTGIDYGRNYRGDSTDSLTRGFGGWPDLNTGSSKVQQGVLSLLKECIDLGADGFRFDAAKHIELPTDPDGSDFWPVVINGAKNYASSKGIDLYCYGEILDNSGTAISNYTKYMAVTDNRAGNDTRENVKNGNASGAASSYLYYSGEKADNIVLWAESHDTYANDNFTGPSVSSSQDVINRTWAIVASRDFAALYYIRPSDVRATMGAASGNTSWKNKEVAEVNKFHNYFSGTSEYLGYDGNVVYNVRNKAGVVLVNVPGGSASVNFSISKTGMADGTYTDQVTGNKFTVSGGNISGQIGNTGIAVVYNAKTTPTPTISQQGGSFSSDTLTLTLGLKNAIKGTYKIGSASAQDYTGTKTITIGSDMSYGDSVTITLTATDGSTTSAPVSYTFTKTEQTGNVAYLKLPSGWGTTVYCYAYDSATEKISNGTWPGVQMTLDSSTGYYKYEIPENIAAPRVIFYNSDSNRYPADMEKGLLFETDGSWLYDGSSWKQYSAPVTKGTVIVKYVDESGNEVASSKTLTGNIGSAYTTSAASVSGYALKTTPSNATGTYTSSAITVTYVYKKEGWKHDSKGWWYQNADGTYVKNAWKKINGKWYHFDANGYMQTGWYKEGTTYYYLKSNGAMAADEWVENNKYYIDANGKWVEEGWKHDSKGWWYQNADGTYPKNAWKKINGKWYHFDANGYMQTGWYKEGTTYYYLKSNGVMAADEWVEDGKYYIDANGKWVEGKTQSTGTWKHDSKGWWYQNADGTYPKDTWQKIDGNWYHFNISGYMQTGWYKEGSVWYYLKSNGVMAAGEWVKNGKYYIDSNGHWVQ